MKKQDQEGSEFECGDVTPPSALPTNNSSSPAQFFARRRSTWRRRVSTPMTEGKRPTGGRNYRVLSRYCPPWCWRRKNNGEPTLALVEKEETIGDNMTKLYDEQPITSNAQDHSFSPCGGDESKQNFRTKYCDQTVSKMKRVVSIDSPPVRIIIPDEDVRAMGESRKTFSQELQKDSNDSDTNFARERHSRSKHYSRI